MKRKSLLFTLSVLLCCLSAFTSQAQITSVSLDKLRSNLDSTNYTCIPSDLVTGYATGSIGGTAGSSDSLLIKFDFGDGSSSTYKVPIDTGKYFYLYKYLPHTYTTAGTYTTKIIVSTTSGSLKDSLVSSPFTLSTSCSITALKINPSTSFIDSIVGSACASKKLNYIVRGTLSGTVGKYDSLDVFFDYGDGSSDTYKWPAGSGGFYIYKSYVHTYTTAGTYTTKIIVTAPSGVKDSLSSSPFTISSTGTGGITSTKAYAYGSFDSLAALCKLPIRYFYSASGYYSGCMVGPDTAIININFGDGSDSTFKVALSSGSIYYSGGYYSHLYTIAGTYTPRVIAKIKSSGVADTVYLSGFTLSDSCATVKGSLYVDDNSNCIKDAGESGVWYVPFRVINTVSGDTTWPFRWSDTNGYYSLDLPAGTYNITPMVNRTFGYWWSSAKGDTLKPSCPTSGSVTLSVAAMGSYTRNFAYECTPVDSFDATVNVSSNCYVPGDTSVMKVWAGDWWRVFYYNCLSLSSSLSLTLDADLSYAGHLDGKAPTSVVGKVITWNLSGSDLALFNSRIKVAVSTTASLGDTLTSTAYIAPATGVPDPVLSNNTHNYARVVVSSFDPNMKESAPNGKGEKGLIAKNTPMTYTIHFQNTGTAPARNITIVDSLESDLDASSFHMISSTHNAIVYKEGNVIKFRFNDIYLPDSSSDYYGSMGSVTFAVLPVRDLAPGTEIKNRAGIYFDYNDPIITNYTLNTIESTTSIQHVQLGSLSAQVYPNPAHTNLTVSVEDNASIRVSMIDMLGRVVNTQSSESGYINIATDNLPSGMYLLNIRDESGNELNTKVMVKH